MTGKNQDQQNKREEKLASLEDIRQRTLEAVPYEDALGGQGADAVMISGIVRATLKEEKNKNRRDLGVKRVEISKDDIDTINECLQSLSEGGSIIPLRVPDFIGQNAVTRYVRRRQK